MAKQQDRHNHLSAFEAALAALKPRGGELNRDRLMFLAGQASAWSSAEGSADDADRMPGATGGLSASALPTAGQARSDGTSSRRWGWPAGFVAMTTLAAGLLVALVVRPPQVVERIVEVPASPPAAALAREDRHDRDAPLDEAPASAPRRVVERPSDWLTFFLASFEKNLSASFSPTDASGYLRLRDLAFSRGVEVWPAPATMAAAEFRVSPRSRPASQRELLEELLEMPEARRPERPDVSPESTSHPGAKS